MYVPHKTIFYVSRYNIIYVFKIRFKNEYRGHIVYSIILYSFGLVYLYIYFFLQFLRIAYFTL